MIAIIVTENIKTQNELTATVGSIHTKPNYPNKWWGTERVVGGYANRTDLHEADGWGDVIQPSYNSATQKKGGIYYDEVNGNFTYHVMDKTAQELQTEVLANAESQREILIQEKVKAQITAEAQAETDTQTLLDNQAIYPMWAEGLSVEGGQKYQWFDAENNLVLWEVITAHTTQEDWQPKDVPALFKRVAFDDEYLAWKQPEGAHDAYNIGDIVYFPNVGDTLYISMVNANAYAPLVVAGQWEVYNGA